MAVQAPNIFGALQRGLESERAIRQAPILEAIQQNQLAQQQFNLQQAPILAQQQQQVFEQQQGQISQEQDLDQLQRRARFTVNAAGQALQLKTEAERQAFKQTFNPRDLAAVGITQEEFLGSPVDTASLQNLVSSSQSLLQRDQQQRVQSSQILDDGTTVQVLKTGETRVTDPQGNLVTGEERVNVLSDARQAGIEFQGDRAKSRREGALTAELESIPEQERVKFLSENRQTFSDDILESRNVLDDIDRAIAIWESSPGTISGPFAGRLPSLTDKSQELESILTGLGIDRLGAFKGATSEREMSAAFRAGASMDQDAKTGIRRLKKQRKSVERNNSRLKGLRSEADGLLAKQPTQAQPQTFEGFQILSVE